MGIRKLVTFVEHWDGISMVYISYEGVYIIPLKDYNFTLEQVFQFAKLKEYIETSNGL